MTDYHSAGANYFKTSAFTDGDNGFIVACVEHSDLGVTYELEVATCPNLSSGDSKAITVKLDACGKSDFFCDSDISEELDLVACACISNSPFKSLVLNAVNLYNCDNLYGHAVCGKSVLVEDYAAVKLYLSSSVCKKSDCIALNCDCSRILYRAIDLIAYEDTALAETLRDNLDSCVGDYRSSVR